MKAIMILLDSLNRHALADYNEKTWVKTPNISRLAQKSIVFDQHWSGSLPCMPARRDIMTGRLAFLEKGWGGIEPFDVTLPQKLREAGVFSHIVTDHYHYFRIGGENYCQSFDTWDFHRGQEVDPWVSQVKSTAMPDSFYGQTRMQYEKNSSRFHEELDYSGPRTMQAASQWLKNNKDADQFLLVVEAFDPHEPFDSPSKYRELYEDEYDGPRFNWPKYDTVNEPPEAIEHLQKRYAANLTMIDHWLGTLLDTMDEEKLWEDTMVIFTTDHGILLGEHGFTGKNFMHNYNIIAHLPLLIHMPGLSPREQRIHALTQNIDLMPTILDFFGIEIPSSVRGKSLIPLMNGEIESIRDDALYGMFGMAVNITDGRYTYLRAPVREDNTPCSAYTAMPTSIMGFMGNSAPESIEAGIFLNYTSYPVFRIPISRGGTPFRYLRHVRVSELYDIVTDYEQHAPIQDRKLEEYYEKRLIEAMQAEDAPEEQYIRLGLWNAQN